MFLGVISFVRLPIDLLPSIAYPRLVVHTRYPDVGPSEVERFVTEPIEQVVGRVPGVERVESVSREGISLVTLRFSWGTDMDFAALNVREQLDNIRDALPELAGRPTVLRTDPNAEPIMAVSAAGRISPPSRTSRRRSSGADSSRSTGSPRRRSPVGSSARSTSKWTRACWRRSG